MARLFIPQEQLDEWTADSKVVMESNQVALNSTGLHDGSQVQLDGLVFAVQPGVRFMKVAGDEDDSSELLNTVLTEEELVEIGADLYMSSVIHGDIAYDVQCGFIGRLVPTSDV